MAVDANNRHGSFRSSTCARTSTLISPSAHLAYQPYPVPLHFCWRIASTLLLFSRKVQGFFVYLAPCPRSHNPAVAIVFQLVQASLPPNAGSAEHALTRARSLHSRTKFLKGGLEARKGWSLENFKLTGKTTGRGSTPSPPSGSATGYGRSSRI